MDLSFLPTQQKSATLQKKSGFNPCSYGSFVLTDRRLQIYQRRRGCFNPCSYGSFVLTCKRKQKHFIVKQFQSLFLWIFRSYFEDGFWIEGKNGCFNPCSYGSFVLTVVKNYILGELGGFQSLFLWIFRSYVI